MILDLLALAAQLSGGRNLYQHFYLLICSCCFVASDDPAGQREAQFRRRQDHCVGSPDRAGNHYFPKLTFSPFLQLLTSCGYWETFTSEQSWTRVGQWLYEVEKSSPHFVFLNFVFFVFCILYLYRWKQRWLWDAWCRRTDSWPLTWMATHVKSGFFSMLF